MYNYPVTSLARRLAHCIFSTVRSSVCWAVVVLVTLATLASAAEPMIELSKRFIPERVTFQKVERGIPPMDQGDYFCLFHVPQNTNGVTFITGEAVSGSAKKHDFRISYANLHNDDIIAMMGALYRVTDVNSHSVICARLDKQDFPAHIWPSSEIIVPYGRTALGSGGGLYKGGIGVLSIAKADTEGKQALTAKLKIVQPKDKAKKVEDWYKEYTVKVGDLIPVNDSKLHFRIDKIVPPDEKQQIYGWIELSADPVAK